MTYVTHFIPSPADAINQRAAMTDEQWNKSLMKGTIVVSKYKPSTPEELEAEHAVNTMIDMGYDQMREEAEEALRLNPQDSDAISKLAIASQHAYLRKNPQANRIIRRMNPRTDGKKFATWVRTTLGWALRCPKGETGDTVHVRMKGGGTKPNAPD